MFVDIDGHKVAIAKIAGIERVVHSEPPAHLPNTAFNCVAQHPYGPYESPAINSIVHMDNGKTFATSLSSEEILSRVIAVKRQMTVRVWFVEIGELTGIEVEKKIEMFRSALISIDELADHDIILTTRGQTRVSEFESLRSAGLNHLVVTSPEDAKALLLERAKEAAQSQPGDAQATVKHEVEEKSETSAKQASAITPTT